MIKVVSGRSRHAVIMQYAAFSAAELFVLVASAGAVG